jgi:hypothetical protein
METPKRRPYSFARRSEEAKKMVSIRLDIGTKNVWQKINELLSENGLPKMSQSEIIEEASDEFYENLKNRLKE